MGLIRHGAATAVAAAPRTAARAGVGAAEGPAEGRERVVGSHPVHSVVRTDLDEVFRRDYRQVVGVAARVLGSRDHAEDVAQDVFLAFGRSPVPAGEARGWLCVAAAHTALNLIRSGRRRTSREETARHGARRRRRRRGRGGRDLEEQARVRAALARLPRRQAVALVLRHSGLSYAEVAAALDLSPGSVGTTVRRAESTLRKELNRHATSD